MHRYWGDNYNQLLTIKVIILFNNLSNKILCHEQKTVLLFYMLQAYWDPENVFNFCQSVGSTDNMCCPFTLARPQGPPASRP
jgi:hypothetical protein